MKYFVRIGLAIVAAVSIAACGGDDNDGPTPTAQPTPAPETRTVYEMAAANDDFTTLVAAIDEADLDVVLNDADTDFTVFAPTNAAFEALGADAVAALLANADMLEKVLTYHVVAGAVIDAEAAISAAGTTVEMASGSRVGVSLSGNDLFINNALVTMTDIDAVNGVIHVIDAVLMPPADEGDAPTLNIVETAQANEEFSTLVAALTAANLVGTLSNADDEFTVFAPTNAAFDTLGEDNVAALLEDIDNLTAILQKHVISGVSADLIGAYSLSGDAVTTLGGDVSLAIDRDDRKLRFGGADFVMTDIRTTNGIIHVIDTVVVGDAGLPKPDDNIAQVAGAAGNFTVLLDLLVETGLDETLTAEGSSFTVFAPTDAAFEDLPEGFLEGLNDDALRNVLLYHVISGSEVLADSALAVAKASESMITMANDDMASLSLNAEGQLFINASGVSAANVMASNGVIHAIDAVLLPPADSAAPTMNIVETATAAGNFTTLLTALGEAGLDDALADESASYTVFAPTDDVFAAIDEALLDAILADADTLSAILGQHVIAGAEVNSLTAFTLNGKEVEMMSGAKLALVAEEGVLSIGGANIVTYDILTTNGIIHVIDSVIVGDVALPDAGN